MASIPAYEACMKQSVSLVITDHGPSPIARSSQATSASSFETSGGILQPLASTRPHVHGRRSSTTPSRFAAVWEDRDGLCSRPARNNSVVIWPDGGIDVNPCRSHSASRRRAKQGRGTHWIRRPASRLPSPALRAMNERFETRVGTNGNPDIACPSFRAFDWNVPHMR